jgi:hypothetical protein
MSRKAWALAPVIALFVCAKAGAQEEDVDGEKAAREREDAAALEDKDRRIRELEERMARMDEQLAELRENEVEDELGAILAEAEAEAEAPDVEERLEDREFLWGALALQKLNPEISVSADFLAALIIDDAKEPRFYAGADDRSSAVIREVGFQIQHVLDPFSNFKAAVNFFAEPNPGVEVEEIYMTWFGIIPSVSMSVGRFRQNLGQVNRWHGHDLDQTDYPLAMTAVLGEGGVAGTGLAFKWFMPPLWASANELSLEFATGENDVLFAGEFVSVPTVMGHLKNYWDLSESTYMELGLTGMWGMNNRRGYINDDDSLVSEPWRQTIVAAADLTLNWNPLERAKYRSFTWRTEGYFVKREMAREEEGAPLGLWDPDGERMSWGAFSYIDVQLHERWFMGVRGDLALPTVREEYEMAWDVVPYLTFWQSEFVYIRLEYQHGARIPHELPSERLGLRTDDRVLIQVDWAAGPHKHEKY